MDLREVWKRMEVEKLTKPVLGAVEVRKTSTAALDSLSNGTRPESAA